MSSTDQPRLRNAGRPETIYPPYYYWQHHFSSQGVVNYLLTSVLDNLKKNANDLKEITESMCQMNFGN